MTTEKPEVSIQEICSFLRLEREVTSTWCADAAESLEKKEALMTEMVKALRDAAEELAGFVKLACFSSGIPDTGNKTVDHISAILAKLEG